MMVDAPKSSKSKKRIRSLFSPEQSKLIRSKALPETKQPAPQKVTDLEKEYGGGREAQLPSEPQETYRFEVELTCNRELDEYPEISFTDLIKGEESDAASDEDQDDADVKKISEYFENKYGKSGGGRRHATDVQMDLGYDTEDPFVDDSEAFDEVIPDELDTQHGGFYINFGDLMFRKVTESESDDGVQPVGKKRKREEEERKQKHQKNLKSLKIREKYKKIEKDVKKKKRKIVVEDDSLSEDSDDSATTMEILVKPEDNSSKPKESSHKELATNPVEKPSKPKKPSVGKTNSAPKPKKKEKKSKSERKVVKKKSKDVLEDERRKLLDVVQQNKPFTGDKLHLIEDNLASIEYELRRNHSHSRRAYYEELITKMGDGCEVGYLKIKNLALSALNKKNTETLDAALAPLKVAISNKMFEQLPSYNKKRTLFEGQLASWKVAQESQKEGEELARPKAPPKTFKWTEEIRALYGNVIQVKSSQLKLIRIKSDDQFDLMKRYLVTLTEAVWPRGWVTVNILTREAQNFTKLFANKRKKGAQVNVNPLKSVPKLLRPAKSTKPNPPKPKHQPATTEPAKQSETHGSSVSEVSKTKPIAATVNKPPFVTSKLTNQFDAAFSDPKSPLKPKPTDGAPPAKSIPKPAASHDSADLAIIKDNIRKISANLNRAVNITPIILSDDQGSPAKPAKMRPITSIEPTPKIKPDLTLTPKKGVGATPRSEPLKATHAARRIIPQPVQIPTTITNQPTSTKSVKSSSRPPIPALPNKSLAAVPKPTVTKSSKSYKPTPGLKLQPKEGPSPPDDGANKGQLAQAGGSGKLAQAGCSGQLAQAGGSGKLAQAGGSIPQLISPRSSAVTTGVPFNIDGIPADFINNIMKKYGASQLNQIKEQGLFPLLLKEELEKLSGNNDVIIIDDNVSTPSPVVTPPGKRPTHSSNGAPSSSVATSSKLKLFTDSPVSHANPVVSQAITNALQLTPKVVTHVPIPKAFSVVPTPKVVSNLCTSGGSGNHNHQLTNSRPSVVITKSSCPVSIPQIAAVPSVKSQPVTSIRQPDSPSTNKQSNPPITNPVSTPGISNNTHQVTASPKTVISTASNLNRTLMTPHKASRLSISSSPKVGSHSLGSVLGQHPQMDTQSLNTSSLKSLCAKLQTLKDANKEKGT